MFYYKINHFQFYQLIIIKFKNRMKLKYNIMESDLPQYNQQKVAQ